MAGGIRWLAWAREIQALSQSGLYYAENEYQRERYRRLSDVAAEIVAAHTDLDSETLKLRFAEQVAQGYATPKVDVRGACFRDGELLLVCERADGGWCMPGGWADVGEVPSAMVEREVREESGFLVKARKVIGMYDANRDGKPLAAFHAYKVVMWCDLVGGAACPSPETSDVRFFGPDSIPPLSSARTSERLIRDAFAHLADPNRPADFD